MRARTKRVSRLVRGFPGAVRAICSELGDLPCRRQNLVEVGRIGRLDLIGDLSRSRTLLRTGVPPADAKRIPSDTDEPVRMLGSEVEGVGCHGQPLIAPAASPETIFRLKKMNMIRGGMVINSTFMKSRFHWVRNWLWKLNSVSWTVAFSSPGRK